MKQIIILAGIIFMLMGTNVDAKNVNKTIGIESINQIDIEIKIGKVTIYESDSEKIKINGSITGNSSRGIESKILGDTAKIKQKIGFIPIKFGVTEIFIGIPANFNKNVTVRQSTGKLIIKTINVDSLNIKTRAASLDVDDIVFKDFNLKAGSGRSNVDLKRKCGNMTIDSSVGKVKLKIDEIGGDIKFYGGTMGGALVIPKNAPVDIIKRGDKKCQISATTSDKGNYNIFIKPGVGKIKVIN